MGHEDNPRSASFESTIDAAQDGRRTHGISIQAFLASLTVSAVVFVVEIAAFILLRNRLKHLYQPRRIGESQGDGRPSGKNTLSWIRATLSTPNTDILADSGLDAFFFLRYLQFLLKLFLLLSLITLPFVLPFNLVHGKPTAEGVQGLDRLTWASVGSGYHQYYWVHLCITAVATFCICVGIYKEYFEYIRVRHAYLTSHRFQSQWSARTVLFTGIPREYTSISALQTIYGALPGGVKNIFLNRELGTLAKKVRERKRLLEEMEVAMTKKIRRSTVSHTQGQSYVNSARTNSDKRFDPVPGTNLGQSSQYRSLAGRVLADYRKKRSIEYKMEALSRLDTDIRLQIERSDLPPYRSAFIEFHSPAAASLARQSTACSRPFSFLTHMIGTTSDYILWDNLNRSPWQFYVRSILTFAVIVFTIMGWAIPIALTGSLSQISYLASITPGLTGITMLPTWLLSPIEGVLPQILLVILLSLVPVLFRAAAFFQGHCTAGAMELAVQRYYFCFLFVQVFLTVSISSSATTIIRQVYHGVDSVPTMLATNLPKSSNYFLSYLLLQAFSISSGRLLRPPGLAKWLFLTRFANATPRQKWRHESVLQPAQWGTVFPVFTNIACIAIIFSVIAPLISVLAVATFGTTWFVFRYEVIYISKPQGDTSGEVYPLALNQLFTGVYTMHICVIGLFLLERTPGNHLACLPQALLTLLMAIITVVYQVILRRAFQSLIRSIPLIRQPNEERYGTWNIIWRMYRHLVVNRGSSGEGQLSKSEDPGTERIASNDFRPRTDLSQRDSEDLQDFRRSGNPYLDTVPLMMWLPRDPYGICAMMIAEVHQQHPQIKITNDGTAMDRMGHLTIDKVPNGVKQDSM